MNEKIYILYVEDNEGDYELLLMLLERYAFHKEIVIELAETVEEGKALFNINKHCAALLDFNLPDGNGFEVGEFIRAQSTLLPVFILSGIFTDKHINQAQICSPTLCLEKNFDTNFLDTIISFLRFDK